MSLLEKLAINRKITAVFADGSRKMNLSIATVVDLLKGVEKVPVQIAPVKRAERLLTDLAETSGRIVEKADDGVFLAQPAVDAPTVEETVTQPVVEEIAQAGSREGRGLRHRSADKFDGLKSSRWGQSLVS
jgi:hypothetical protein